MIYALMGYLHATVERRLRRIRLLAEEAGQGTVEYVGLILLVSLLMVGMVAAMKGFNRPFSKTRYYCQCGTGSARDAAKLSDLYWKGLTFSALPPGSVFARNDAHPSAQARSPVMAQSGPVKVTDAATENALRIFDVPGGGAAHGAHWDELPKTTVSADPSETLREVLRRAADDLGNDVAAEVKKTHSKLRAERGEAPHEDEVVDSIVSPSSVAPTTTSLWRARDFAPSGTPQGMRRCGGPRRAGPRGVASAALRGDDGRADRRG